MLNIIKSDLYRLKKSKLFYSFVVLTGLIPFLLMILNRQDIRLGISVFGKLTTFITANDVIKIGIEYQKGLGIIVALLVSVFISQEYLWNTWQHKWLISKSRIGIYLSKTILASLTSTILFLLFETVAFLFSGQIKELFTSEYIAIVVSGSFLYATLGAVTCLVAMLIKNSTMSAIVSLCYILFSENLATIVLNISSIFDTTAKLGVWCVQHSIYGISSIICSAPNATDILFPVMVNSLAIIGIAVFVGILIFHRYEL